MKHIVIYSVVFSVLFISCNGQDKKNSIQQLKNNKNMNSLKEAPYNTSDEGDGTKSNYDNLSIDFIKKAKKILEQRNFEFPDDESFNQKILEVYGYNLKEYKNSIFVLQPSMFPEIAIRIEKFIFLQEANANEPDFINTELLYHYNSYIFRNSFVSYIWLQSNFPEVLKDLVVYYGYNKDKKLVETVFERFDFSSLINVEELIFKDLNSKKKLKKQIFDDIENIVYRGCVEDFSYAKEGNGYVRIGDIINKINASPKEYVEPDESVAFLFERELRVGIQGDIESYMNKNPQYESFLKKHDFYNFPTLKDYVQYIYQKESNNNNYIIHDPDGYTNLRKDKTTTSEVLQKIKSGEYVEVLDSVGDWYLIKTKEGKKGYVHKSRIKSE